MIKDFKFFRGDEYEISQIEWNRRRDALADRLRVESEERISKQMDNILNLNERLHMSIWQRIKEYIVNLF